MTPLHSRKGAWICNLRILDRLLGASGAQPVHVEVGQTPSRGRDDLAAVGEAQAGGSPAASSLGFVQLFASFFRDKSRCRNY